MKLIISYIIFFTVSRTVLASVLISGTVSGNITEIKYFKPFKHFGNEVIESVIKLPIRKNFSLDFDIDQSSTMQFKVGNKSFWLLVEPTDTISIFIDATHMTGDNEQWLSIRGKNASGNIFYNSTFNKIILQKFNGLRSIFTDTEKTSTDTIFNRIKTELKYQTSWVDSLLTLHQITPIYASYMKTDITSGLAWEVGNLCDNYFSGSSSALREKGYIIKNKLFFYINPLDPKLQTCVFGQAYYDTYLSEMKRLYEKIIDTSQIILGENDYIALAPVELQEMLWGRSIMTYINHFPDRYNPCTLYKKYKDKYKSNEFISHLDSMNICNNRYSPQSFQIVHTKSLEFFDFIAQKLPGRRLYIDLWATWCLPCKIEFKYYNQSFYRLLDQFKIKPLFISIDESDRLSVWENVIQATHLKGYHVFADSTLKASIKDLIFDGKSFVIPRYILVNEKGSILNISMKRPSDMLIEEEIKRAFNK